MRAERKWSRHQSSVKFFIPLVDTALSSLNYRFSRLEDVYNLDGQEILRAIEENTFPEKCRKLERALHDIDSEDLVLEIRAAYHALLENVSSPSDTLTHIYKKQLLDLHTSLYFAIRLLMKLAITIHQRGVQETF